MTHFAQRLFDDAARSGGAAHVAAVLHPLIADFARYIAPLPADRALDAGTGTGSLARLLAPQVTQITGLDASAPSLKLAQRNQDRPIRLVQGDLERPPFAPGTFSLITAHFGLNLSDPRRSLRALRRVLMPGGRIVVQEWGPAAEPLRAADEVLAAFALVAPGEPAASLREAVDSFPAEWESRLQDVDDYLESFAEAGFTVIDASESAPVTLRLSVDALVAYLLAETIRATEVDALPESTRAACLDDLRSRLRALAGSDGLLDWSPVVIRLTARV